MISHAPALRSPDRLDALVELLADRRFVALVGAGCSTESGIPDYRGPGSSRTPVRPIMYQEFVRSAETRARYWSRSAVGWRRVADARPNPAHRALADLEAEGILPGVITQNVDGLHVRAGSRRVVELHGSLAEVRCLGCGTRESRAALQARLLELNPAWAEHVRRMESAMAATPDGDAAVPERLSRGFTVPGCRACGGVLKPDVVFFGENVPAATVEAAWAVYAEADALLVVGSSLTVYSGRRFVDRAARDDRPVAVVNLGPTRADDRAAVRVEARAGEVLPRLVRRLGACAGLVALLLACSSGSPSGGMDEPSGLTRDDSAAVAAADRAYADAWLTNDAAAVMATFVADPVIVPSGLAPIAGSEPIRAFWFPADAPPTTVHRFDLMQSEIAGAADFAYVRGSFTLGFDYDGASYESAGTYLSILRRSEDGWRIARRTWNDHRRE